MKQSNDTEESFFVQDIEKVEHLTTYLDAENVVHDLHVQMKSKYSR